MSSARPLAGCHIAYSRSSSHYESFRARATALGASCEALPLMATRPLPLTAGDRAALAGAEALVFTSAAAARHLTYPLGQQEIVAIGPATAAALPRVDVAAPPPFNSEALLAAWQPRGRRIAILGAPGGRGLLRQALAENNEVAEMAVYERFNPSTALHFQHFPQVLTIASCGTLDHLLALAPPPLLRQLKSCCAIAAISGRVAQYAEAEGFARVFAAARADENAQLASICYWWRNLIKEQ